MSRPNRLRTERAPNLTRESWYCHAIGTLVEEQGKGYGKAMLKHMEIRARRDGKKMGLMGLERDIVSLCVIAAIRTKHAQYK
jgi:GNAT superfamily N-acetyltransferase